MSYLVLARKYRPRQFSELVGQKHVATTLLHAFQQNKLGQAYLFTGTRGVGKTSVARIFAKALRCEDPLSQPGEKNRGLSCDKCPSCLEINKGNSMDVLEIDGASNNGVENVREIREQVKFMPSRGKMKVYIIDEVHMLSNAAFNALLKTLEEPPSHVTFLFATTEVQKIPATILSRCQRFDFKRVPQPLILEHLMNLTKLEGVKSEPGALPLIAKKADGSVRDALSALDQCIAFAGKDLSIKSVTDSLGIVSTSFLLQVLSLSFQKDLVKAAELLREAFLQGVEMKQIAVGLADTLRNALFVKLRADSALSEIAEEERKDFEAFAHSISSEALQAAYKLMIQAVEEILRSPLPRASLEMTLVRLSGLSTLKSLESLLESLQKGGISAASNSAPTPGIGIKSDTEKKNSEPLKQTIVKENLSASVTPPASSAPSGPALIGFKHFAQLAMQNRPSLGALLEHAIPITPDEQWGTASVIHIGFRKSNGFYQMQAQHKANFEQLEKMLHSHLKRVVPLKIESVVDDSALPSASASVIEKEQKASAEVAAKKKQRFMEHEIVQNTKEIFGAELASFDIDKSKA